MRDADRTLLAVVGLTILVACGGSDDRARASSGSGGTSATSATTGGSGGSGASGGAGGSGGGGSQPLELETIIDRLPAPFAVAVVAGSLFFNDAFDSTIKRCDVDDCPATVATFAEDQLVTINGLRHHDGFLVWAGPEGAFRCPLDDCSAPEPLLSGEMRALAVDDSGVYAYDRATLQIWRANPPAEPLLVAEQALDARHLVVAGGDVYFPSYGINPPDAAVYRCSIDGCRSATRLDGGQVGLGIASVAVEGDTLAWAEVTAVKLCPIDGCTAVPDRLLPSSESYDHMLLLDGSLFVASYSGGVHACRSDDCGATQRRAGLGTVSQGMAWDDDHVYVVGSSGPGDGRIVRTRRDAIR
jgi:hypothetical protein